MDEKNNKYDGDSHKKNQNFITRELAVCVVPRYVQINI